MPEEDERLLNPDLAALLEAMSSAGQLHQNHILFFYSSEVVLKKQI